MGKCGGGMYVSFAVGLFSFFFLRDREEKGKGDTGGGRGSSRVSVVR